MSTHKQDAVGPLEAKADCKLTDERNVVSRVHKMLHDTKHIALVSRRGGGRGYGKVVGCRCESINLHFLKIVGVEVREQLVLSSQRSSQMITNIARGTHYPSGKDDPPLTVCHEDDLVLGGVPDVSTYGLKSG